MLVRNLLFLGLCTAVAAAVAGPLLQSTKPPAARWAVPVPDHDLQDAVDQVNAAIRHDWTSHGLSSPQAPPAPDLAIARRMSLALTGTIPSLEEIRTFESQPESQRLDRWLEHLLADRRYSDYVAERLARTYVGVDDGPFLIYRRRRFVAWLSDQLTANRPFDAMVRDLIASDGLWTDTPAVNFITVTITAEQQTRADENRLAARVARAFLGVRLDCAQCHDHPVRSALDASDVSRAGRILRPHASRASPAFATCRAAMKSKIARPAKCTPSPPRFPSSRICWRHDGGPRQRLAAWVTNPQNRAFARATVNRAWALLFGRPLVEPIDSIPLGRRRCRRPRSCWPTILWRTVSTWRRLIRVIAGTAGFQRDSRSATTESLAEADAPWAGFRYRACARASGRQLVASRFAARPSIRIRASWCNSAARSANGILSSAMATAAKMNSPIAAGRFRNVCC